MSNQPTCGGKQNFKMKKVKDTYYNYNLVTPIQPPRFFYPNAIHGVRCAKCSVQLPKRKKIYTAYVFMLTYYTYLIKVIPNTFDHSSSGMEGYVQAAKIM
jgi:hypothetical protein